MIKCTIYDEKIVKRYDDLVYDVCYEYLTIDNNEYKLSELTNGDGYYFGVENGVTVGFMIEHIGYILEDYSNIKRGERHETYHSEVGKLKRLRDTLINKYDFDYIVAKYDFETEKEKRALIREWFGFTDDTNVNAFLNKFESNNIIVSKENKDLICDYKYFCTWEEMFNWMYDKNSNLTPWEIAHKSTHPHDYKHIFSCNYGYYFFYCLNY